jgi:NhaP-type Na+/H+ or K+/H+ antiporter
VSEFSKLALFSVLFTDGMGIGVREIKSAWHLPGRALLLGFPLNLALVAVLAHWIAGLPWIESLAHEVGANVDDAFEWARSELV